MIYLLHSKGRHNMHLPSAGHSVMAAQRQVSYVNSIRLKRVFISGEDPLFQTRIPKSLVSFSALVENCAYWSVLF